MKIKYCMLVLALVAGFSFAGYAEDSVIDKAKAVAKDRVSVEPYADFVFSRDLKIAGGDGEIKNNNWYGSKVNIKVNDLFTISPLVAGVSQSDTNSPNGKLVNDATCGYGIDTNTKIPADLPVDLNVLAGWRGMVPGVDSLEGVTPLSYDRTTYNEWSTELQVSKALVVPKVPGTVTPVLGIRYSDLNMEGKVNGKEFRATSENIFGMTAGVKYDLNDTYGIQVNGKFIDQTALTVAATVKF